MNEKITGGSNQPIETLYFVVIGFALCWAVTYIAAYSFVLMPPSEFSSFDRDFSRTCYLGGIFLSELIIYLLSKSLAQRQFRLMLGIGIFLVMLACVVAYALAPEGTIRVTFLVATMFALGLWQGVFHILWLEIIFHLKPDSTIKAIYLSIILGAVIFVITVLTASSASVFALLFLALLSLVIFLLTVRLAPEKVSSGKYLSRKTAKDLYKSNIILVVYGAVFGVGIYACMTDAVPSYISYPLTGLALAAGVAFLYVTYVFRQRFFTFDDLSVALLPLIAVALLILSFSPEGVAWIVYLVVLLLLTMFDSAAFLHIFDITRAFDLVPLLSIARERMIMQCGMFAASFVNLFIAHYLNPSGNSGFYMSLILIFFLFVMIAISGTVTVLPQKAAVPNDGRFEDVPGEDELSRVCRQIALTYDLSKRELEVLDLLMRGHQAQAIAEKLFISKNTVKSHISHIYRKMGVTSKQEVIDIRDSLNLED